MNIDYVPAPKMECPQCGATEWRHFDIPGNTRLQHQLLQNGKRLISVSFAVFVAASYLFIFSATQELGFIAAGVFLCLAPLSILIILLTDYIRSTVHLCESCGFYSSE